MHVLFGIITASHSHISSYLCMNRAPSFWRSHSMLVSGRDKYWDRLLKEEWHLLLFLRGACIQKSKEVCPRSHTEITQHTGALRAGHLSCGLVLLFIFYLVIQRRFLYILIFHCFQYSRVTSPTCNDYILFYFIMAFTTTLDSLDYRKAW